VPVHWHQSIASLAEKPGIFIANEFLDALPFHQFVKTGSGWRERVVATTQDQLTLSTGPATLDPSDLPLDHHHQPVGSVFETAPARTAIVETLASRLHRHAGAALIIDYGHAKSGFGDTFQAVHRHQFVSPLASPGKSDLTSHVDFDALSKAARSARCHVPPILTQGEFLLAMGLVERAGRLGSNQSVEKQNEIRAAVERLAGPQAMGNLFKVMAIAPQTIRLWPFEPILSPSGQS
jgi:SAM-dependent MidA family methyltransferase